MATTAYADLATFYGSPLPKLWSPLLELTRFGNVAIVVFLVAQCLDGIFTYVGVSTYGIGVEANPLIAGLMINLGHGLALVTAKSLAAMLGLCLHMREIHGAVALLAGFYVAVAIVPWMALLLI
jgi:hypothetical protein